MSPRRQRKHGDGRGYSCVWEGVSAHRVCVVIAQHTAVAIPLELETRKTSHPTPTPILMCQSAFKLQFALNVQANMLYLLCVSHSPVPIDTLTQNVTWQMHAAGRTRRREQGAACRFRASKNVFSPRVAACVMDDQEVRQPGRTAVVFLM